MITLQSTIFFKKKAGGRTLEEPFVEASVLQWGQIKKAPTLSKIPPPFINNTDAHLLLFIFAPNDCTKFASTSVLLGSGWGDLILKIKTIEVLGF